MIYGVKCSKCGLMQMPKLTCKACGAALEAPPEPPPRVPSKVPPKVPPRLPPRLPPEVPLTVPSEDQIGEQTARVPSEDRTASVRSEDRTSMGAMTETSRCSECGMEFSDDELIRFGDTLVCAKCKPLFVQRLREGVPVAGEMVYAGFWIRAGAKIIDGIILSIVGLALGFVGSLITSSVAGRSILQNVLSIVLDIAYVTYFLGTYSATPGKMACGLKVVRPDGERISYARACGRSLAEFVSSLILGIGYLMVIFDEEKRALHDRICDTRVVKKA